MDSNLKNIGTVTMLLSRSFSAAIFYCWMFSCVGCSSLGLTFYPAGEFLTESAEAVLDRSPRNAQIPRELDLGVVHTHFLQPGDVLLIEPVDLDSDVRIPADQSVLIDGTIDLGGFGRIVVAGLTLEMVENLIERTIVDAGHERTAVNVRLLETVHRYYVLGAVNSPGSYPLEGNETVLDAIVTAGGLTSSASPCKILLARPTPAVSCRITLPVCYREITQLGDTTTNYQLQPGDRIFVASRGCCEELMFWRASKSCDRCGNCQSPCMNPAVFAGNNPVTRVSVGRVLGDQTRSERSETLPSDTAAESSAAPDAEGASRPGFEDDRGRFNREGTPTPLPAPIDGELEFAPAESPQRFEPLWISPPEDFKADSDADSQRP